MSFPIDTQIPNAPNDPADDQPKMKDNFVNIDGFLSIDHVDPGATFNGMHKQVQLYNPADVIPNPSLGLQTGTGTIYTEQANGQTQLFYTNGASGNEYQLTRTDNANFSTFGQFQPGWTFLPGGLILQWGVIAPAPNGATTAFVYPLSTVLSVTLGPTTPNTTDDSISIRAGTLSGSGFTVETSAGSNFTSLGYMVIGY